MENLTYPVLSVRSSEFIIYNKFYGSRNYSEKTLKQNLFSDSNIKKEFDNLLNVKDEINLENWLFECKVLASRLSNDLKSKGTELKNFGTISKNSVKQYKKRIELFVNALKYNKSKDKNQHLITFVTLTLPAKQMHSDLLLKKCLNRFINLMQKSKGVKNYVWKAEAQKNDNIHFHILMDKFINWQYVRNSWNSIIEKLGYISAYRDNMLKNGFKHQKDTGKCFNAQLNYYNEQKSQGFKNPNSTDIHELKNIYDPAKYITKYMCKIEKNKRPIYGNIIRSSSTLSDMKYLEIEGDLSIIQQIEKDLKDQKVDLENCTIVKANTYKYFAQKCKKYKHYIINHYKKIYASLYAIPKDDLQRSNDNVQCEPIHSAEIHDRYKKPVQYTIGNLYAC